MADGLNDRWDWAAEIERRGIASRRCRAAYLWAISTEKCLSRACWVPLRASWRVLGCARGREAPQVRATHARREQAIAYARERLRIMRAE